MDREHRAPDATWPLGDEQHLSWRDLSEVVNISCVAMASYTNGGRIFVRQ